MTGSSARFLLLPLSLSYVELVDQLTKTAATTHDRHPLQRGRTTIKHEDWFDSIEKQLAYPPQKAKDVCVDERASVFVTHSCLELVYPDRRVNSQGFALYCFEPGESISVIESRNLTAILTLPDARQV